MSKFKKLIKNCQDIIFFPMVLLLFVKFEQILKLYLFGTVFVIFDILTVNENIYDYILKLEPTQL